MKITTILAQIPPLARAWAAERAARQERTSADQADFDQLRRLGVPLMAVPVECGGTWESLAQSARPICTMLRILAQGDPSITLASAMHQGVLGTWRIPTVPDPYNAAWQQQRQVTRRRFLPQGSANGSPKNGDSEKRDISGSRRGSTTALILISPQNEASLHNPPGDRSITGWRWAPEKQSYSKASDRGI